MYQVSFFPRSSDAEVFSRVFSTLRAARRWAQWLSSQPYVAQAMIRNEGGVVA
jgi:hypothetical protein